MTRVRIVGSDRDVAAIVRAHLQSKGFEVTVEVDQRSIDWTVESGEHALEVNVDSTADVNAVAMAVGSAFEGAHPAVDVPRIPVYGPDGQLRRMVWIGR